MIFSLAVVGYTLIGGFLAAVWTDLLQSVMMFIGVMILVVPGAAGGGGTGERDARESGACMPGRSLRRGRRLQGRRLGRFCR